MYKVMKYVEGEWYVWGTYSTVEGACKACFYLGQCSSVEDVKIEEV